MGNKYDSLEELRRKKALLKQDIAGLEDLLSFENTKESLSAFTNGFTDQYLKEVPSEDGGTKTTLKTDVIIDQVKNEVKENIVSKSAVLGFASSAAKTGLIEDAIRLGATAFVTKLAVKNMNGTSWKKKIIGLALIYLAPMLLRIIRRKLENYQKNRSVSSMEQLI